MFRLQSTDFESDDRAIFNFCGEMRKMSNDKNQVPNNSTTHSSTFASFVFNGNRLA
jgi:hypothetical protein